MMTAEEYAEHMRLVLRSFDSQRPRSRQTQEYRLGVSDIGGCPQYAVYITKQEPFSDAPDKTAAMWGTFMHDGIEKARIHDDPSLIVGAEVTIDLPNGVQLTGHPDVIDQAENSLTDDKTVDGLGVVDRHGPSEHQEFQLDLYALGAVQAGLLDPENLTVRLIWYDRSGAEHQPVVWQKQWHPDNITPAVEWLDNVIYAVKHGEEAEKTPAFDFCAATCPFFSKCRLPDLPEVEDVIEDQDVVRAVESYLAGHELEAEGKRLKKAGRSMIDGISGMVELEDGRHVRARWISIGASKIAATERKAYKRLDLREV